MKNYYGLIVGSEYDNNWMQMLGKNKYYFKNPIHQNYGHILSLKDSLQIPENKFISIVCFSNQAKLRVKCRSNVVQLDYLNDLIKSFRNVIINEDLSLIKSQINALNKNDYKTRTQHVMKIKEKISNENNSVKNMICPRCGGNLVVRVSKNGTFLGCSNYPRCRFTKNK